MVQVNMVYKDLGQLLTDKVFEIGENGNFVAGFKFEHDGDFGGLSTGNSPQGFDTTETESQLVTGNLTQ